MKKSFAMRALLNPRYLRFAEFAKALPASFDATPDAPTLHEGRNTVKVFTVEGERLAVKSFVRFSPLNRMLYGTLRASKAVRAYSHAKHLKELGIGTPEAVAAVDVRRGGVLCRSYYVSVCSDYLPLSDAAAAFPDRADEVRPVLDAFVEFVHRLHDAGVLHRDLNITNVLYRLDAAGGVDFQIIDINRMSFRRRLSTRARIENLRRLGCNAAAYIYILDRYGRDLSADRDSFQLASVAARLLFELRQRMKHRIKVMF